MTPQPHFIDVKFNSEQVPGCPIQCDVFDTSRITASGQGLERVCVGRAAKFVINTAGAAEAEMKVTIMCEYTIIKSITHSLDPYKMRFLRVKIRAKRSTLAHKRQKLETVQNDRPETEPIVFFIFQYLSFFEISCRKMEKFVFWSVENMPSGETGNLIKWVIAEPELWKKLIFAAREMLTFWNSNSPPCYWSLTKNSFDLRSRNIRSTKHRKPGTLPYKTGPVRFIVEAKIKFVEVNHWKPFSKTMLPAEAIVDLASTSKRTAYYMLRKDCS